MLGDIHFGVCETEGCVLVYGSSPPFWLKAKTAGQGIPKRGALPGCFSWGRNVCAVKTELLQNPTCFFSMSGIAFPGLSSYNVRVNGVSYKLGSLLYGPDRPAVADKPTSRIFDGYYHQLNFSV